MTEHWRQVPDHLGVEVSRHGQLRQFGQLVDPTDRGEFYIEVEGTRRRVFPADLWREACKKDS